METLGLIIGYGLIINGLFMFTWAYKVWCYNRKGNNRRTTRAKERA